MQKIWHPDAEDMTHWSTSLSPFSLFLLWLHVSTFSLTLAPFDLAVSPSFSLVGSLSDLIWWPLFMWLFFFYLWPFWNVLGAHVRMFWAPAEKHCSMTSSPAQVLRQAWGNSGWLWWVTASVTLPTPACPANVASSLLQNFLSSWQGVINIKLW